MKILILKPSSLGDVIHALPVLRLLRSHWPDSRIYWWLDINLVPLLEKDPDLAGIFAFQRKRWAAPHRWPEIVSSIVAMRKQRFDLAIDLQGLARSGIFAWLADARLTVGLDNLREGSREGARAFYDLTPPCAAPQAHAVDRCLAVLPLLNVPVHWNFEWLPRRPAALQSVHQKWAPERQGARWIVLLPGGRWDNKRWPAQYFVQLAKRLREIPALRLVVLGSKDERPLGETIAAAVPDFCLNLAGATSLDTLDWDTSGSGFFASYVQASTTSSRLLHVGLDGAVHVLMECRYTKLWAIPSPNGRQIATFKSSPSANIWMVENR